MHVKSQASAHDCAEKRPARFAATVRGGADVDALLAELLRVIQEAMQPQSVRVWLKEPTPPAGHNLKGKNPIDSGRM